MEDSIKLHVPVSISYPAAEGVLKQQLIGMYIPEPEEGTTDSPYAQILDVGISGSSSGVSEVILRVKIRILRTVMKRDQVDLFVLATLGYDNTTQQLFVQQFNLNSRTTSGFYNTALEVMVNKVAYGQILNKARVNVGEIVGKQLENANNLLGQGFGLKGINLLGKVSFAQVQDVTVLPDKIALSIVLQGNLEVDVQDLSELMPVK